MAANCSRPRAAGPEGCARYVLTDVRRDGTSHRAQLDPLRDVLPRTVPVTPRAGNRRGRSHRDAQIDGVEGAIVGKALYAGAFTLPEALAAVR